MKRQGPTEKNLTRTIMLALRSRGAWVMKTHGSVFGRSGLPDLLGTYKGRSFAFEVKRPGGRTTRLQEMELEALRRAGAVAAVVTSAEGAIAALVSGR